MKTVVFINEKGGIGKTSVCFNLAWELSKREKRVLMVDLDGQRANLTYFAGTQKEDGQRTVYDVLRGKTRIREAVRPVRRNLDLVPANVEVTKISQTEKISVLKRALQEIREEYDYIFLDVPPTPGWVHVLALSCSDGAVIPMLPDVASLEANLGIYESIEEILETSNPGLQVYGILFNRYAGRANLTKEVCRVTEQLAERLHTRVFGAKIRQGVALSENVSVHQGITDYDPKSGAADDYRAFADEFQKEAER